MGDDKTTIRRVSWFTPLWYLFIAGLGYFTYGGLAGAWAAFLLVFGLSLLFIVAAIPFVGLGLWLWAALWVRTQIFTLTGITATGLTSLIWWTSGFGAVIVWLFVILLCIGTIKN